MRSEKHGTAVDRSVDEPDGLGFIHEAFVYSSSASARRPRGVS